MCCGQMLQIIYFAHRYCVTITLVNYIFTDRVSMGGNVVASVRPPAHLYALRLLNRLTFDLELSRS